MASKVTLDSLVQGVQFKDPRLYDVLRGIINELKRLGKSIDIINQPDLTGELTGVFPPSVELFSFEIRDRTVHFSWLQPSVDVVQYEIRQGSTWSTATRVLITNSLQADIDPIAAGTTTYLIKSIDANGIYSVDPKSLDVIVHAPEGVTITTQIIDNNVLLFWSEPAADFIIDYYEVKRDSTVIGTTKSTFSSVFETTSGSYSYSVTAIDIAGNRGTTNSVAATVKQPPDYELTDLFLSVLDGTCTDCVLSDGKLIAPVNNTETYQEHFVNNSYTSPQDQVDAGYPYYVQPTPATAEYEETKDFGSIYANVIVNLDWDYINIAGSVTVTAEIEASDDGMVWGAPIAGVSAYFESVRYVRVTLTFTPGTVGESFMEFFNFRILLDVKREVDGGIVAALASDVNGTTVTFNKSFKDVESITVTPLSTTFATAIYDFVDAPNPTSFKVLVYDQWGNRMDKTISWKARGIV